MICELVTAAALTTTNARPPVLRRICLHTLIRKARREGAIIVDFRHGRVILPALWREKL